MAGFPSILKDFALYINGFPTRHNVSEFTPPKIAEKTQDINMGMFASEVSMGLEKLTAEMVFYSLDTTFLVQWGLLNNSTGQLVSLRGYIENNQGKSSAIKIDMRGRFKSSDSGTWKRGDIATTKVECSLWQYNYMADNKPLIEIDIETDTWIISGVNQIPKLKDALGLL